jgi:hypothetical protein
MDSVARSSQQNGEIKGRFSFVNGVTFVGLASPELVAMTYRILLAPPGYGPDQRYLVAAYRSLEYSSCQESLRTQNGSLFAATLEEARSIIPQDAERLPFVRDHQFIELWETGKD